MADKIVELSPLDYDPDLLVAPVRINEPRLPERFRKKIIRDLKTGCWLWVAGIDSGGYGNFYDAEAKKSGSAHRYAYKVLVGPIPEGKVLDHLCRVRRCVNPAHLEPVTQSVNIARGCYGGRCVGRRRRKKVHS